MCTDFQTVSAPDLIASCKEQAEKMYNCEANPALYYATLSGLLQGVLMHLVYARDSAKKGS